MSRTPPKSRDSSNVRIIVEPREPSGRRYDDEPPGYSGHNGGSFNDAGYRAGRGLFGFHENVR